MKKSIILFICFLSFSSADVFSYCVDSDDNHCSNVSSTEEYAKCMADNISKLTNSCQSYVKMLNVCLPEILKLCSCDNESCTIKCLNQNSDKLSFNCLQKLNLFY